MGSKDKCYKPRVNAAADCWNNVRPLGSLSQNRPIHVRGVVERPTLRGCLLRVSFGRVVALLQRLPCQKTKPKGLHCGYELCWF